MPTINELIVAGPVPTEQDNVIDRDILPEPPKANPLHAVDLNYHGSKELPSWPPVDDLFQEMWDEAAAEEACGAGVSTPNTEDVCYNYIARLEEWTRRLHQELWFVTLMDELHSTNGELRPSGTFITTALRQYYNADHKPHLLSNTVYSVRDLNKLYDIVREAPGDLGAYLEYYLTGAKQTLSTKIERGEYVQA